MPAIVTFEVAVRPEHRADILAFMESIAPETRAYAGCLGVEMLVDRDDPGHVILRQRWASAAEYERYRDWRRASGFLDPVRPWLARPPAGTIYTLADAWP